MKKTMLLLLLTSSLLFSSDFDRANASAADSLKGLDCEFEDCTPKEPKIIIQEKIVEKVVVKEVPVSNTINIINNHQATANKYEIACNQAAKAGATTPEAYQVNLGKNRGEFLFEYETYQAKDRITIVHESKIVFDSGCVGTNGVVSRNVKFAGSQNFVTIQTIPNCQNRSSSNTKWTFTAHCPK